MVEKHAHAGRAAWGVLGSAAGGRVFVLPELTPATPAKFRWKVKKLAGLEVLLSGVLMPKP